MEFWGSEFLDFEVNLPPLVPALLEQGEIFSLSPRLVRQFADTRRIAEIVQVDRDYINELGHSMRLQGQLQPGVARYDQRSITLEDGYHRLLACIEAEIDLYDIIFSSTDQSIRSGYTPQSEFWMKLLQFHKKQ